MSSRHKTNQRRTHKIALIHSNKLSDKGQGLTSAPSSRSRGQFKWGNKPFLEILSMIKKQTKKKRKKKTPKMLPAQWCPLSTLTPYENSTFLWDKFCVSSTLCFVCSSRILWTEFTRTTETTRSKQNAMAFDKIPFLYSMLVKFAAF